MSASNEGRDRIKHLKDFFLALFPAGLAAYLIFSSASGDSGLRYLAPVTLALNFAALLGTVVLSAFIAFRRYQIERWTRTMAARQSGASSGESQRMTRKGVVLLVLASPILLVIAFAALCVYWFRRIFLWRGRVSIGVARRFRNCLLRDRKWRWHHFGIVPWLTINSILFDIHCRTMKGKGIDANARRGVEAVVAVREACAGDEDVRRLRRVWQEFEIRTPEEFMVRDRSYLMERSGVVLTEAAKVAITHALLMREADYVRLFELMQEVTRRKFRHMLKIGGLQSEVLLYFAAHEDSCREKFVTFRKDILAMARRYADNMMMFSAAYCSPKAAHAWYGVGEILVRLEQDLPPSDANEPAIRRAVDELFERMSKAFAFAYLKYHELDERGELEKEGESSLEDPEEPVPQKEAETPPKPKAEKPKCSKLPIFETKKKVGRFRIDRNKHGLIIEDSDNPRGRQKRRYAKIHAPTAQRYFNEIFAKYDEGYDEFLLPGDNPKWRSSCKGEANDFINEEMQTWTEAHPDATREEKHAHLGWYRIIPDRQPLKD